MHAGLHSPVGDTKANRHFGQPKPEVVVEDQDGALLDGETPKGALELVPVLNVQVLVRPAHGLGGKEQDALRPAPATPGLGVAGIGEDPVEPGLEELGVSQGADFAPRGEQCRLHGVVSKVEVAQDPERDRHASVTGQASQGVEGLSIASLRLVHQLCVHPSLRGPGRVASYLAALGLESPDAAYRFNL
jgi:hypothetical protein